MPPPAPSAKQIVLQAAAIALGPEALETIDLSEKAPQEAPAGDQLPYAPMCITQQPTAVNLKSDPTGLVVGLKDEIPRWQPGSVIKWAAWRMGYDSQEDANYAAEQLYIATQKWNDANVGVRFEHVALADQANFVICHGGDFGDGLARAFFPNSIDLNFIHVYSRAFKSDWKPNMWKVLTHELGHVLGLRHEFALEQETDTPSVQFKGRNPLSVMNYRREAPEIQPSDIDGTRAFYALPEDTMLNRTPIHSYVPR